MANFEIPENPDYTGDIRKLEPTDPAHADLFNNMFQIILINQAFLKKLAEQHIVDTDDKFSIYYQQLIDYVDKVINELIGAAPETLDTIEEVARAIQENETVMDALNAAIGTKASKAEFDTHASNNTIHITAAERTKWDGKAEGIHAHNKVANTVMSMPIYNNATGTIIDFAPANINTMVCVRITGNGYQLGQPIDCVYQFYNYTAEGIIAFAGIANGLPLTLKVFRHDGRCKGWVVQSQPFQTLQIEVTIGIGESGDVIFTAGAMPTSGVSSRIDIIPYISYHTGRKPTAADLGFSTIITAITGTGAGARINVAYPSGFNSTNCIVVSITLGTTGNYWNYGDYLNANGRLDSHSLAYVLDPSGIKIYAKESLVSTHVKIVLLKYI